MTRVYRNGSETIIPANELVRGDVVKVNVGDQVPADLRVLWCAGKRVTGHWERNFVRTYLCLCAA